MKKSLIFFLSLFTLLQVYAQKESRALEWSIGPAELTRGEQVQVRYPLMLAISKDSDRPQLGTSTMRFFYDAGYLYDLEIVHVANDYDISGLSQSKDVFGEIFGFAGKGGIFAQFDLIANQRNLLDLSAEPVHVLDFSFTVKAGAEIPLCAALVLDNQLQDGNIGSYRDAGYLANDAGIVGTYFLNNDTHKAWLADDEVMNYLWDIVPAAKKVIAHPDDRAGLVSIVKSRGCIVPNRSLPAAELLEFKAFKQDHRQVVLDWMTDSEFNNDFFEVQRSADGLSFEPLGRQDGQWNAIAPTYYSFLDEEALEGVNYYRLMQVDRNGAINYSPVQVVGFDAAAVAGEELNISFYPNPTKGITRLTAGRDFYGFTLLVFDSSGRLLMQKHNVDSNSQIDVSGLGSGNYTLSLKDAGQRTVATRPLVITQ